MVDSKTQRGGNEKGCLKSNDIHIWIRSIGENARMLQTLTIYKMALHCD